MSNYPLDDVQRAILALLPDAEIGHDNDGQLVVYTGLTLETDDVASGEVNPAFLPVEEGVVRFLVLNDGDTWTDAANCQLLEWTGDSDPGSICDDIELAMSFGDETFLRLVGEFDGGGVLR